MVVVLVNPLEEVVKAINICDIKNENAARRASVVARGYGLELLLACSIPNLQFNVFILPSIQSALAVNPYRHGVSLVSQVLGCSQKHARLPTARVSYYDYFEHVIVLLVLREFPPLRRFLLGRLLVMRLEWRDTLTPLLA